MEGFPVELLNIHLSFIIGKYKFDLKFTWKHFMEFNTVFYIPRRRNDIKAYVAQFCNDLQNVILQNPHIEHSVGRNAMLTFSP